MSKTILKIALDRLDRHAPFFMDAVTAPDGVELQPLEVGLVDPDAYRDGADRHGRMFRDQEFDVCEQSLASFIIARSRGDVSLVAAPVFPRRLFSQLCMFVNVDAGIETPRDLTRQAGRYQLASDHAVRAGQGRSEIRVRCSLGGHPLVPATRRGTAVEVRCKPVPAQDSRRERGGADARGRGARRLHPPVAATARLRAGRSRSQVVHRFEGRVAPVLPQARVLPDHARHGVSAAGGGEGAVASAGHHRDVGGGEAEDLFLLRRSRIFAAAVQPQRARRPARSAAIGSLGVRGSPRIGPTWSDSWSTWWTSG